jgi:hypothetical protein
MRHAPPPPHPTPDPRPHLARGRALQARLLVKQLGADGGRHGARAPRVRAASPAQARRPPAEAGPAGRVRLHEPPDAGVHASPAGLRWRGRGGSGAVVVLRTQGGGGGCDEAPSDDVASDGGGLMRPRASRVRMGRLPPLHGGGGSDPSWLRRAWDPTMHGTRQWCASEPRIRCPTRCYCCLNPLPTHQDGEAGRGMAGVGLAPACKP